MKLPRLFAGLATLVFAAIAATAQPAAAPDRVARAKQATADRLAYAASAGYNPYDSASRDSTKTAGEALEKNDFTGAIAAAGDGLKHSPYDIELLIILASAQRGAGDTAKADATRTQWISLIDSILGSGDGRSYETAFRVIDVREEYAVLRILRLQPGEQFLEEHNGSQFDVLKATAPGSDQPVELYFNIDLPKRWLDRQFAKPN